MELAFFIPSTTFLGVVKLLNISKKILGTLRDALRLTQCDHDAIYNGTTMCRQRALSSAGLLALRRPDGGPRLYPVSRAYIPFPLLATHFRRLLRFARPHGGPRRQDDSPCLRARPHAGTARAPSASHAHARGTVCACLAVP